ncbi:MAG: chorismate mutase, partial [Planctomycetes bacterium]|nr:chorismate mutase [Planctomycetota bacterium]
MLHFCLESGQRLYNKGSTMKLGRLGRTLWIMLCSVNRMNSLAFFFLKPPTKHVLRFSIDRIDDQIVLLLRKRIELAKRTRHVKDTIEDPVRERQIVTRLSQKKMLRNEFLQQL